MKKTLSIAVFALTIFGFTFRSFAKNQEGTVGGGGGHTIRGLPLESYAADVTQFDSYKKIVLPMLIKIDNILPTFGRDLRKTISEKIWYFVPVKLNSKELSFSVTGIPLAADLPIRQTPDAVWVDTTSFNNMSRKGKPEGLKAQGLLILHELVMGAVLFNKSANNASGILNASDEEDVRSITINIFKNIDKSPQLVKSILAKNNLGTYPSALGGAANEPEQMKAFYVNLVQASRQFPFPNLMSKVTNSDNSKSELLCNGNFSFDPREKSMTVHLKLSNIRTTESSRGTAVYSLESKQPEPIEMKFTQSPQLGFNNSSPKLSYRIVAGDSGGRDGELRRALYFLVSSIGGNNRIESMRLSYVACRKLKNSSNCFWVNPAEQDLTEKGEDTNLKFVVPQLKYVPKS